MGRNHESDENEKWITWDRQRTQTELEPRPKMENLRNDSKNLTWLHRIMMESEHTIALDRHRNDAVGESSEYHT